MLEEWIKYFLTHYTPMFILYTSVMAILSSLGSSFVMSFIFIVSVNYYPKMNGLDFSNCLILAYEGGKLISNLLGLFIVSRIQYNYRLLLLVMFNVLSIFLISFPFAFLRPVFQLVGMFLGMFILSASNGIIIMYLEGRRLTETLLILASISILFGPWIAKSVTEVFLNLVVTKYIPLVVGIIFLPISLLSMVFLNMIPEPSSSDVSKRSKRRKMTFQEQKNFLKKFSPGFACIMVVNLVVLLLKNFREYFSQDIYHYALGDNFKENIYFWVDFTGGSLAILSIIFIPKIEHHKSAFSIMQLMFIYGGIILLIFSLLYSFDSIPGLAWLMGLSCAMWIVYLPINCAALWDRLFAVTRIPGTVSLLIYMMDILGGIGTIVLMSCKLFGGLNGPPGNFFLKMSFGVAAISIVASAVSLCYFQTVFKKYEEYTEDQENSLESRKLKDIIGKEK